MTELQFFVDAPHVGLFVVDKLLSQQKLTMEEVGELVPSFFHVHNEDLSINYLNRAGCNWFGLTTTEVHKMGTSFFERYMHPTTVKHVIPRAREFYQQRNISQVYQGVQSVWDKRIKGYTACFTAMKISTSHKGFIALSQPIDHLGNTKKIERILQEEAFVRQNFMRFKTLTLRERQIMRLLGLGLNNPQIGDELFISRKTVEQHRKHINQKLGIKSFVELLQYVHAFDLLD